MKAFGSYALLDTADILGLNLSQNYYITKIAEFSPEA